MGRNLPRILTHRVFAFGRAPGVLRAVSRRRRLLATLRGMFVLLCTAALGAPLVMDAAEARLSGPLRAAARLADTGDVDVFRLARPSPPPVDGLSVTVESDDPDALLDRLDALGIDVEAAAGDRVQAHVPYGRLREVAALPGVRRVREPWIAEAKERFVSSGYADTMEMDWRAEGYDGTGVRVGILDVGFARYDEAAGDPEVDDDEEVPPEPVTDFTRGSVEAATHGTAVTEIVYDFAPGATYYLATFGTEVEYVEALQWLVEQHVDVINASIGFDNTAHADGYSYVTRAVEAAVEEGIIYVGAAGNENDKYRVGALARAPGGGITLAGAEATEVWTSGGFARVSLRWSEPFGAAATDLDLVLYNEDGTECGRAQEPQDGDDDPYESVLATDCSELVTAVIVGGEEGVDPLGLEGYLYAPYTLEAAEWTNTEDLTLPGDTRGGISVGAIVDGLAPDYSSRGPTNDGRTKPDVVAPTGVYTSTGRYTPFTGTSAAAPHVSGLAALWVDASNRQGQPEVFRTWLRAHARDVGPVGDDDTYGAGVARADALPPTACGCRSPGAIPTLSPALLLLVAAAARRRAS